MAANPSIGGHGTCGIRQTIETNKLVVAALNGAWGGVLQALSPWDASAVSPVSKYIGLDIALVANLTQYPLSGVPQTAMVGRVDEFPVLYACGTGDSSDLCKDVFGQESGAMVTDFTFLKVGNGCGHGCAECDGIPEAIIANVQKGASAAPILK
jgi:hypothetical protein